MNCPKANVMFKIKKNQPTNERMNEGSTEQQKQSRTKKKNNKFFFSSLCVSRDGVEAACSNTLTCPLSFFGGIET